MAIYDRRLLVPYLQDVCSSELLCARLEKEISQCSRDIASLENTLRHKIVDPCYPIEEDYKSKDLIPCILWTIAFLVVTYIGYLIGANILGIPIMIGGGLYAVIFGTEAVDQIQRSKKKREEVFQNYYRILEINKQERAKVPQFQNALCERQREYATLVERYDEAENLRDTVYSVNIIPSKYRDKYAVYYLYDYFRTSRENDLDKIIQTLLLDEIKQKLDKIISQNEEIALAQRYQIALQEGQNKAIAENHREQLQQIARLESNQELQLDYQRMIATNQEVTNFFLASDYIEKYRNR